jgi:hypothetical protein
LQHESTSPPQPRVSRRFIGAFAFAGLSTSGVLVWGALGGHYWLLDVPGLTVAGLFIGVVLSVFQFRLLPSAGLSTRLSRFRMTLYGSQLLLCLSDVMSALASTAVSIDRSIHLATGVAYGLQSVFLALMFDFVVIKPVEIWLGDERAAPGG